MRVKWLGAAGAAIILIALPAISWYYLKKGADWRRSGLAEMADKQPIDAAPVKLATIPGDSVELREGVFAIATNIRSSAPEIQSTLDKIAEQFDHQEDLLFLYFGDRDARLAAEWAVVDCRDPACSKLSSELFGGNTNMALIDDSLNVRATYNIMAEGQTQKLAEHGAILFPVEKRKKIELKRGVNQ